MVTRDSSNTDWYTCSLLHKIRLSEVPNTHWGTTEHYTHPKSPRVRTHLKFPRCPSTALLSYQTAPLDVHSKNVVLHNHRVKLVEEGVGEKARQREHVAEDLGSVSRTHMVADNHLWLQFQRVRCALIDSVGTRHVLHIHTYRRSIHTHNIKITIFKNTTVLYRIYKYCKISIFLF